MPKNTRKTNEKHGKKSDTNASNAPKGVRFAYVTPTEAAEGLKPKNTRQNATLTARQQASAVYRKELDLTPDQRGSIDALYASDGQGIETYDFVIAGQEEARSQEEAAALMASYGLTCEARDEIGNRWSNKWSNQVGDVTKILLQCDCGYDHTSAGSKKRNNPVPFAGCLAHAEITFQRTTKKIYLNI